MKRLFNTIDEWKIIQDKIEFEENRLAESIMSIGNGYMGMRGNYEEYYSKDSHRGSYIGEFGILIKRVLDGGKMDILIILARF